MDVLAVAVVAWGSEAMQFTVIVLAVKPAVLSVATLPELVIVPEVVVKL
jgi:hypothetical protein